MTQYTDQNATPGSIYAYRAIALAGGRESSPAEDVWAMIPLPPPPDPNPDSDDNGIPDSEEPAGNADADQDGIDNAHDTDNDNDGIADRDDEWPDDPRLSEPIPPMYYGAVDLSKYTYQGSPLPGSGVVSMAIDNNNNVSWIPSGTDDPTLITWKNGEVYSIETYPFGGGKGMNGFNASGLVAGVHTIHGNSAYIYTALAMPDERQVPNLYTGEYASDNSDFVDGGFHISFSNGIITNEGMRFGTLSYVTGRVEEDGDRREQQSVPVRYLGGSGQIQEMPITGSVTATSDNGSAVIMRPPPVQKISVPAAQGAQEVEVQTAQIGSANLWANTSPDETTGVGIVHPFAVNNQFWIVGTKKYWVRDPSTGPSGPITWVNDEGPEPNPANPFAEYGRGELGFVWDPVNGMRTFHDLLPAKYKKALRSAIPFMLTNADSNGKPRIFFRAKMLTSGNPNVWKDRTLILEWEDPDGAGPKPEETKLRYVSLGERYNSASDTYTEVNATFFGVNDQLNVIGIHDGSQPAFFGPIEILDNQKNRNPLNDLVISKWEEAFVLPEGGGFPDLKSDFISELHDSFHIRYPFSKPPLESAPKAWFGVKRRNASGSFDPIDNETEIGVQAEAGRPGFAITKKSHILVSSPRDDSDPLLNSKGTDADETNADESHDGDRTHLAALHDIGELKVTQSFGTMRYQFPVCHRKRMKTLPIKMYIFRKSVGGALCTPPDVPNWKESFAEMLRRRLAQVNILPIVKYEVVDPPEGLDLSRGLWTHRGVAGGGASIIVEERYEATLLRSTRAARSEDDVEIFVVNYFSMFNQVTNEFQPYTAWGFASPDFTHQGGTHTPRLIKPGADEPYDTHGPRWLRGTIVVSAEGASGKVPSLGDPGVFESVGGHELTHILADSGHKGGDGEVLADPLDLTNLVVNGIQSGRTGRRHEHPLGDLRLNREQEERMRKHRALK